MKSFVQTLVTLFLFSMALSSVLNVSAAPCDTDICLNGGTCGNFSGVANCTCAFGYDGLLCQNEIDYCEDTPCLHSGVCHTNLTNQPDGYTCNCTGTGYVGATCQTLFCDCADGYVCKTGSEYTLGFTCIANPCNSTDVNPCSNNGTCSAASGTDLGFECDCTVGWGGDTCTTQVSSCTPNLCQHDAPCTSTGNHTFSCACPSGTSGPLCQFGIPNSASVIFSTLGFLFSSVVAIIFIIFA